MKQAHQQVLDFTIQSRRACPHCKRRITGKNRKDLFLALQSHRRWNRMEREFRRLGTKSITYRGIKLTLEKLYGPYGPNWECVGVKERHTATTALRALKGWLLMYSTEGGNH